MNGNMTFKSSYFLRFLRGDYNPFTPNILTIDDDYIEHRRRNWYLISVDTENLHFQNITGITIDTHLFGATLLIKSKGTVPIKVHGFWKKQARRIKEISSQRISANTQRGTINTIARTLKNTGTETNYTSIAEELKKLKELMDQGVISRTEFDDLKKKLI